MLWGREASALKCYQFSLALQSGHNHTSYSYNYKIAFTVFFKENSKLSFEERGFSKAAFQRTPTQTSLLIPFTEKKDSSQHQCRKLLKPEKKVFRQWVEIQFLQFGPNQMSTSKIYYAWEIKRKANLELQRLNSILVAYYSSTLIRFRRNANWQILWDQLDHCFNRTEFVFVCWKFEFG